MALNYSYKTKEEIPEGLREHYTEKDGAWILDGYAPKTKLDEFRDTNINLKKEKDELVAQLLKFKDIDPVRYEDAVKKLQELENKQLEKAGEYKLLMAEKERSFQEAIKAEQQKTKDAIKRANMLMIDNEAAKLIGGLAVPRKDAMKYVLNDIRESWTVDENGEIVSLNEKGVARLSEKDPSKKLTLAEWLPGYISKSSLFEDSKGGGANGGMTFLSGESVELSKISGQMVSAGMIEKLASGEINIE